MRQEIISDKAQDYLSRLYAENEYPCGLRDIETDVMEAFIDGAQWRINSVWHEAIERPNNGKPFLYVAKYRHTDEEKYDTEYMCEEDSWDGFITEERLKKWAYIDDLLPGRKEGGR